MKKGKLVTFLNSKGPSIKEGGGRLYKNWQSGEIFKAKWEERGWEDGQIFKK